MALVGGRGFLKPDWADPHSTAEGRCISRRIGPALSPRVYQFSRGERPLKERNPQHRDKFDWFLADGGRSAAPGSDTRRSSLASRRVDGHNADAIDRVLDGVWAREADRTQQRLLNLR